MKLIIQLILLLTISAKCSFGQNVMINIITQNNGLVEINGTNFLEITISNTSAIKSVDSFKLRPQISFPVELVAISEEGHILPKGWTILSKKNGTILLSNGADIIPELGNRTVLISFVGKKIGGQSTIAGTLNFSNGTAPGSAAGAATKEDNLADNSSSTTITVTK